MKIPGSGRKPGTPNALTSELRNVLHDHLKNELKAITSRLDELPLVDRYKVCAMLFKLVLPPLQDELPGNAPIIVISHDL